MLNVLKEKLSNINADTQAKYNFLREYLQLLILKIIDQKGYFRNIAFVGGTALRILYDLNRFSEDLDFSLVNTSKYSFEGMMETIIKELKLNNITVDAKYKATKTVAVGWLKFPNLLHGLNLASLRTQKLSIKIEVDLKPPNGWNTELSMITKEFLFAINHYDLPSLYAGKLHALLFRGHVKGRDFYDFLWYTGKKIEPNYKLLEKAILQTQKEKLHLDHKKLQIMLKQRINNTDFNKVKNDLLPFLANADEAHYFNKEFFLKLLK